MRRYRIKEYARVIFYGAWNFYGFKWRSHQDPAKIRKYQEKKIKKLLCYAYHQTRFYRRKYDRAGVSPDDFHILEDLEKFPTVSKDEIINNFPHNFIPEDNKLGGYIESISSGSSGRVVRILHRARDTWPYGLGLFRMFNSQGNYGPLDRVLFIYTSLFPARSVLGLYPTSFISTLNPPPDTKDRILKIKPAFISSYPSHMLEMMGYFSKEDLQQIKIKGIYLGSELSSKVQRKKISDFFQCPVFDEYSSEELGWIACECQHYHHHIWEDISFIEILDGKSEKKIKDGNEGEIVGTNLHNYAVPFIRYRQGDYGVISADAKVCPCGSHFRVLEKFIGRQNDCFILPSGRILSSAYLLDSTYSLLLDTRADINDFCLIQKGKNNIELEIKPGTSYDSNMEQMIKKRLQFLFKEKIKINIKQTDKFYKTASGKRNPIISLVGK